MTSPPPMTPADAARAPTANVGQTLLWLVALAALLLAVLLWQRLGRVQDQLVHKSLASAARADEAQARQALQVAQAAMPRLVVAEGSLDDLQAWRQQADELLKTAARA